MKEKGKGKKDNKNNSLSFGDLPFEEVLKDLLKTKRPEKKKLGRTGGQESEKERNKKI